MQGGLTGSLFREFALTLAGAVTISGVVALTLSPMMSAHLLRRDDNERGFSGHITRQFARLRGVYGRMLDRALAARACIYAAWVVIALLTVPMYLFAPKELAPTEDQGVIFGVVTGSANATLDQTSKFAAAANQAFLSEPETEFTFQLTNPSDGFGGMVVKPWGERKRTIFQIMPEVSAKLQAIPGIQMFPVLPPALPGGGTFPVEFVLASTADTAEILQFAQQIQQAAATSGKFYFPPIIDVKVDQPQSEIVIDRDKVASLGLNLTQVGADLASAVGGNYVNRFNISGRSYKVIPQIKRDRPAQPGPAPEHLRHRTQRPADAAQHDRHDPGLDGAALAQPVPAAECREDQRESRCCRSTRRCASSRTRRRRSCRAATRSTTPANRASCAPRATSSCRPSRSPSS